MDKNADSVEGARATWKAPSEVDKELCRAARDGNERRVRELIALGANVDTVHGPFTPLVNAARGNHASCCLALLDAGADVDLPEEQGQAPLMVAAIFGFERVVELLVCRGARVDALDFGGCTPLMGAAFAQNTRCVAILARRGAHVDALDGKKNTAKFWAHRAGGASGVEDYLAAVAQGLAQRELDALEAAVPSGEPSPRGRRSPRV